MQQKLSFGTMLAFALKGTPIWRLIVTIILCALAFGMFGLAQSFASIDLQDMILQGYCNEPVLLSECPRMVYSHPADTSMSADTSPV